MVCQARLKQWGTILALYAQDNEGRFPCDYNGASGLWLLRGTVLRIDSKDPNATQDSLYHFRTKNIACCPLATKGSDEESPFPLSLLSAIAGPASIDSTPACVVNGNEDAGHPAWVLCLPVPRFVSSYGTNEFLFRPHFQSTVTFVPQAEWHCGANLFSLGNKANIPVVLDSSSPWGGPPSANEPPPGLSRPSGLSSFCLRRHGDFVNGVFLDWSVRKIGLKELWKLKWFRDFNTNGRWTQVRGVKPEDWPLWMRGLKDY